MLPGAMTDVVRTPEERLEGLPDFPFRAHYREVEGLRLAAPQLDCVGSCGASGAEASAGSERAARSS
jgi:hypothetical protein